jgi:heterodisulfide reductase subunit A
MGKAKGSDKITVHLSTKVKHIEGFVGNFVCTLLADGKESVINVGAIIIATGAEEYKPDEYLYGKDTRVMTQLELEEKLGKGELAPQTVVMIQCVGSRSTKDGERGYCSRICCTHAMKAVLAIKEKNPKADVYVLYRDIRTYGFKEDLYRKAREAGAIFSKYYEDKKPEVTLDGKDLKVRLHEEILGKDIVLKPDLIVLSSAITPQKDNEDLAQMLKVPMTKDEFFLEAHMKLRPVDFATEGVYLCGGAHSPKTVEESITQASGAVARAVTVLSKDKLETEGIISSVNTSLCNGCGICVPMCEYGAISLVDAPGAPGKLVADINTALCKGCGSCSCACPSGAMEQKGFRSDQLYAMIDQCLSE